ncbi:hypothetical protein [Flavobacterium notoginsengisoli]|uniref:hypothetical protein n=1 Tax=Flavobacterium notoginsengisoli TaxID=1478199 RepID=UPI00363D2B69
MKKTALTIGLFSLVMVATSFANPTDFSKKIKISTSENIIDPKLGGSAGGGRKQDPIVEQNLSLKNNQSNFADINQSLGTSKKLD